MITEVNLVHPLKASLPIVVRRLERVKEVRPLHPMKAYDPIEVTQISPLGVNHHIEHAQQIGIAHQIC